MPYIVADGPVIKDTDKKRMLVQELTDTAAKVYGLPKDAVVVVIKENPQENVGVGGQLIIDRK
ncbi:tautomerase family protein [bacterium]|nr:tautomerase family protein [bacterium]